MSVLSVLSFCEKRSAKYFRKASKRYLLSWLVHNLIDWCTKGGTSSRGISCNLVQNTVIIVAWSSFSKVMSLSTKKLSAYQYLYVLLSVFILSIKNCENAYLNIFASEDIICVFHSLLHILLTIIDLYLVPETSPFMWLIYFSSSNTSSRTGNSSFQL